MSFFFGFFLITFLSAIFVSGDGDGKWGYRNGSYSSPKDWKNQYKTCGGNRQSPIDIRTKDAFFWNVLKTVKIKNLNPNSGKISLKKSDTTIYLNFNDNWLIHFDDGSCLRPVAMHWHWGSKDSQGSEHSVDNQKYPLEGHLVTYNCNLYNNSDIAVNSASGLHVFGTFYKIGISNPVMKLITPFFVTLNEKSSESIDDIPLSDILPKNLDRYYRYEGSLTIPPCTENVIWTIFQEIQTIDESQLKQFRALMYGKPESGNMTDNFRPIIPVVGSSEYIERVVYVSYNDGRKSGYSVLITLSIILTAMIIF